MWKVENIIDTPYSVSIDPAQFAHLTIPEMIERLKWIDPQSVNKEKIMGQVETEAWFDESSDILLIKVRVWEKTPDGRPYKRGAIFRMTTEYLNSLPSIAEGQCYPHTSNGLEYVGPEESSGKVCNDGLDISICCGVPTKKIDTGMFGDMRVCTKCGK